jgi:3-oxoacyl-[acyl-carrier-protein] synthase-3
VAFVSTVNANLRVLQLVLEALHIPEERSSADYLREFGHFGSQDVFFNVHQALEEGRLRPGDFAVLLTTGVGFFWVSAVVRC